MIYLDAVILDLDSQRGQKLGPRPIANRILNFEWEFRVNMPLTIHLCFDPKLFTNSLDRKQPSNNTITITVTADFYNAFIILESLENHCSLRIWTVQRSPSILQKFHQNTVEWFQASFGRALRVMITWFFLVFWSEKFEKISKNYKNHKTPSRH